MMQYRAVFTLNIILYIVLISCQEYCTFQAIPNRKCYSITNGNAYYVS